MRFFKMTQCNFTGMRFTGPQGVQGPQGIVSYSDCPPYSVTIAEDPTPRDFRCGIETPSQSIEHALHGADFGRRISTNIGRCGDIITGMTLQVTLPEIGQEQRDSNDTAVFARWVDYVGEHLIETIELEVNGMRIDRLGQGNTLG